MVKIEKFRHAVERWQGHFLSKIFNPEELAPLDEGKMYLQRLAARFAVKEAVIKAVSPLGALALKDIVVLNRSDGAPYCELKKDLGLEVLISITHIEEYAVASAIAQERS